jgi:hypothetical protein
MLKSETHISHLRFPYLNQAQLFMEVSHMDQSIMILQEVYPMIFRH